MQENLALCYKYTIVHVQDSQRNGCTKLKVQCNSACITKQKLYHYSKRLPKPWPPIETEMVKQCEKVKVTIREKYNKCALKIKN